ncbi:MAG: hypothetical protein NC548_52435, partial [Lachnospiraceae bacterium]|nr:hypothetical protein [Lachnospiraceae bacterium]
MEAEAKAMASQALAAQRYARAQRSLGKAQSQAATDTGKHISASVNLGTAMSGNLKIAGELGALIGTLYSSVIIKDFLHNVIQIGGELENQKLAITSILGDAGKAETLFSQIQNLAIKSPFGVMDLNQYAKQLTAYSIPYNELYDTMKRLADISAGVGVDFGRIVLAFGQIRAAKFLKGTELRQLTEANIPMIDMLSERFSKLEGRMVSASEIMDMISDKKITFEDVKAVLWELTDEGGRFYNMQEVLSESLASKWKNLSDAIDIMYGTMAEGMGGPLKGVAELLTDLTKNWQLVGVAIGSAAAVFGVAKVATLLLNNALSKTTLSAIRQAQITKIQQAENLKVASTYRSLTAAEDNLANAHKRLTAVQRVKLLLTGQLGSSYAKLTAKEYVHLAVTGKLTKEEALRLIALKKLDTNTIGHLKNVLLLSKAEINAALATKAWRVRLEQLWVSVKRVGRGLLNTLFNPATMVTAALTAVMELIWANKMEMDKAKEIGDNLFTKATEGAGNLAQMLKEIKPAEGLDNLSLTQGIEKMEQAIKDYSPDPIHTINDALIDNDGNVRSLTDRYEELRQKVIQLKGAYAEISTGELNNVITNAINDSNGTNWFTALFNEDVNTNATDYQNALRDRDRDLRDYVRDNKNLVDQVVKDAAEIDANYAAATANMTNNVQKFMELVKNSNNYLSVWGDKTTKHLTVQGAITDANNGNDTKVSAYWNDLKDDMLTVWDSITIQAKERGIDSLADATDDIKEAYATMIKQWIDSLEVDPEVKDQMFAFYSNLLQFDFERFDAEGALAEAFKAQANELLGKQLADKVRSGLELTPEEKAEVEKALQTIFLKMFEKAPELQRKALNKAMASPGKDGKLYFDSDKTAKIAAKIDVTLDWNDWQKELNRVFGGDPTIITWLDGAADIPSFVEAAQKGYKEAKTTLDKLKPLALKAGIKMDFDNLEEIPEGYPNPVWAEAGETGRQMIREYNKAVRAIKAAMKGGKELGFDPAAEYNKGNKKKGGGQHEKKDPVAERIKERLKLLKDAYAEYKKWIELVGKEKALEIIKQSGIYGTLFTGKDAVNLDDYKGELDKLYNQLDNTTKDRRELKVEIDKLRLNMSYDTAKEAAEQLKKDLQDNITRIGKQWDIYKQLIDAGASRSEAGQIAFGSATDLDTKAQALRDNIENLLQEKGLEIPVSLSEEEGLKKLEENAALFGGTESPLYKAIVEAWKDAKEAIANDGLEIRIKELQAIKKYRSVAEKIKALNEEYAKYTGLSVGENGELSEQDGMTDGQKAMFREYQEKLAELKGELLALLPAWQQIFGDTTYKSYGQIQQARGMAQEIVSNAKIQYDADGRPTMFTSSFTNSNGEIQEIKGTYKELEKLIKVIESLYKAGEQKNPFAALWENISKIFSKKKDKTDGEDTQNTFEKLGQSAADSAKMVGTFAGQMSEMFEAMGESGAAEAMDTVGQA